MCFILRKNQTSPVHQVNRLCQGVGAKIRELQDPVILRLLSQNRLSIGCKCGKLRQPWYPMNRLNLDLPIDINIYQAHISK